MGAVLGKFVCVDVCIACLHTFQGSLLAPLQWELVVAIIPRFSFVRTLLRPLSAGSEVSSRRVRGTRRIGRSWPSTTRGVRGTRQTGEAVVVYFKVGEFVELGRRRDLGRELRIRGGSVNPLLCGQILRDLGSWRTGYVGSMRGRRRCGGSARRRRSACCWSDVRSTRAYRGRPTI